MSLGTPTTLDVATAWPILTLSATSGSFTPTANALVLVAVMLQDNVGTDPGFTISDTLGGYAWTKVEAGWLNEGGIWINTAIFWAVAPGSPTAGTVTVSIASGNGRFGGALRPFQITGALTPFVAHSATGSTVTGSPCTVTMPVSPAAGNMIFAACGDGNAPGTLVKPTGFTEIADDNATTGASLEYAYNMSPSSPFSYTSASDQFMQAVGLEVVGPAPPPPPPRLKVAQNAAIVRASMW